MKFVLVILFVSSYIFSSHATSKSCGVHFNKKGQKTSNKPKARNSKPKQKVSDFDPEHELIVLKKGLSEGGKIKEEFKFIQFKISGFPYPHGKVDFPKEPILMIATENRLINAIDFIIKSGSDPNMRDQWGNTPLLRLIRPHQLSAVEGKRTANEAVEGARILLTANADINAQNHKGRTALMGAIESGHYSLTSFLLEVGADPYLEDNFGKTTLSYAQSAEISIFTPSKMTKLLKKLEK